MIIAREIISPSSWYSGKVEQQYKYYVIDNDNNLLFEYAAINISSYEKLSERMKPSAFYKLKDGALETQAYSSIIHEYSRGTHKGTISAMTGTLEENKLEIYIPYTHKEVTFETVFDECITDEIKAKITKLEMPYPIVIIGEDLSKKRKKNVRMELFLKKDFALNVKKFILQDQRLISFTILICNVPNVIIEQPIQILSCKNLKITEKNI